MSISKQIQYIFDNLTLSNGYQIRGAGSKLKVEGHEFRTGKI